MVSAQCIDADYNLSAWAKADVLENATVTCWLALAEQRWTSCYLGHRVDMDSTIREQLVTAQTGHLRLGHHQQE